MSEQLVTGVRKFSSRVYIILAFIAVVSLASGGLSVWLLTRDHDRAVDTAELAKKNAGLTAAAARVAADTKRVVEQIQFERRRNTRSACERTNREHRAIVGFVKGTIPPDQLDDPRVKQYLALAAKSFPVVDCAAEVERRVPSGTP